MRKKDKYIPNENSGLLESLRLLKPTLLQSKSYPIHRLIKDLIVSIELCDDRLGHITLKHEEKSLDKTLLRTNKKREPKGIYLMAPYHLGRSLALSTIATVLYNGLKLKRIKTFSYTNIIKAHENQRLTWLDVCPLTRRLLQVRLWNKELKEGLSLDCLARREEVEPKRIMRLIGLLNLPEDKQELILNNDPSIRELSIRDALKEAHTYQSWLKMRETFERVRRWLALLARGYSQSMIAAEEDLTRARVCQLMKLLRLDKEVWNGVMRGDEAYMGVSLRSLTSGL